MNNTGTDSATLRDGRSGTGNPFIYAARESSFGVALPRHEVYATVAVVVRDPEGLELSDYLRSPARGYKKLREVRIAGVQAFATGPVGDVFNRFIDEQVHLLHGGRIYSITAYAVDSCPTDFERILTTFEFLQGEEQKAQ